MSGSDHICLGMLPFETQNVEVPIETNRPFSELYNGKKDLV